MAKSQLMTWDEFWRGVHLQESDLAQSGLSWVTLQEIREDYESVRELYASAAKQVAEMLGNCESVHSTRYRTKDSGHFVAKIIRKRLEQKKRETAGESEEIIQWSEISQANYVDVIEDLAGVRALHLFKDDWLTIDKLITQTWDFESRFAWVREGDDKEIFESAGCESKRHKKGYRSVHYVIKTAPTRRKIKVEVQVRTIFEEGWSEIDHKVRYPTISDDPMLAKLLDDFNQQAGLADKMGNSVRDLKKRNDLWESQFKKIQHHNVTSAQQEIQILSDKVAELQSELKRYTFPSEGHET